jgi:hypothetical protein
MTSSSDGAAPSGAAPRGDSASSEIVEVYKILYQAGEPLTVPEIVKRFPPGFESAAMRKYREHIKRTRPGLASAVAGTRWPTETVAEAMEWYIRQIIQTGLMNRKFANKLKLTRNIAGEITREGKYTIGPSVPHVRRIVTVEKATLVPWTAEENSEITQRHIAGMRFLTEYDAYKHTPKATKAQAEQLLELAEQAIKKQPSQEST